MNRAARIAAALVFAHCACAGTAAAISYSFRNIADQTGLFTNFGGAPVLNDAGDVAFEATLDDGTEGIFSGPDPGTDTIVDDSGVFDTPIDLPSINGEGTVAFRAWLDPDDEHFLGLRGIFTGDDPDFDTVADEDDPLFAAGLSSPSIADNGTVAFDAIEGSFGNFGIYTVSATGTQTTIADNAGPFTGTLFASSINDAGTTVAFYADYGSGGGIFTGDDLPDDLVADSSGPYFQFDIPAVNDADTVIFRATLDSGGSGIFSGPSSTADRIVGTGGPYAGFSGYSINDEGTVVFAADLDAGGLGIFTGTDPVAHKVIRTGDALFGSTASFVALSRENLNDNGEVAFLYELANGRSGVAIAAPGELERTVGVGTGYDGVRLTSAAGSDTVARLRGGIAGETRTLALAFSAGAGSVADVLELAGSGDDELVLELAYDDAGVADETALRLYGRGPDGVWRDAVLGNTPPGGPFAAGMSFDEYRDSLGAPPQLGAHGNDPDGNTVWAIVDHGGRFAVPEPGATAGFLVALLALRLTARLARP